MFLGSVRNSFFEWENIYIFFLLEWELLAWVKGVGQVTCSFKCAWKIFSLPERLEPILSFEVNH